MSAIAPARDVTRHRSAGLKKSGLEGSPMYELLKGDATELEMAGSTAEDPLLATLKDIEPAEDRTCKDQLYLVFLFARDKSQFLIEIWLLVFCAYYLDVALDIKMMTTFYQYGDINFVAATLVGIGTGVLFTLVEMTNCLQPSDPSWMTLVVGFLLPFQLHVLFLCGYSTFQGHPHPLLHSSKLAESAIEGTMSALVQTYALIFRSLEWEDLKVGYISLASSFASIGWAFTQFDRQEKGMAGLPGVAVGADPKLALVGLFRVCEVISRVVSLSLFQLAVRNEPIPGLEDYFPDGLGNKGSACVILLDFIILVFMIFYWQAFRRGNLKNLAYAFPSVISFMNPMLLDDNAFTVPAWAYFCLRVFELAGMVGIAWKLECFHPGQGRRDFHDGHPENNLVEVEGLLGEFKDDRILAFVAAGCTVVMLVLVLLIRCWMVDNVLLQNNHMFQSHAFSETEDILCEKLLDVDRSKNDGDREEEFCREFHDFAQGQIDSICHDVELVIEDFRNQQADRASGTQHVQLFSSTVAPSSTLTVLEEWRRSQLEMGERKEHEMASAAETLLRLIHVAYNLHHFLKGGQGIEQQGKTILGTGVFLLEHEQRTRVTVAKQYVTVLQRINECLDEERGDPGCRSLLQNKEHCRHLLRIVPEWEEVKVPFDGELRISEEIEAAMQLFEGKCRLVVNVMRAGWARGQTFKSIALEFHTEFAAKPEQEVQNKFQKGEQSSVDPYAWVLQLQMMALIDMFASIPRDMRKTKEAVAKLSTATADAGFDLFRPKYELQALMDGAENVMKHRDTPVIAKFLHESVTADATSTIGAKEIAKAFTTVIDSFQDDLVLKPNSADKAMVQKALGILLSEGEFLRLKNVAIEKTSRDDGDCPEPTNPKGLKDVRNIKEMFRTVHQGSDSDIDPQRKHEEGKPCDSRLDLREALITFTFERAKEIEKPYMFVPGKYQGWRVHETSMLKLFRSLDVSTMAALYDGKSASTHNASVDVTESVLVAPATEPLQEGESASTKNACVSVEESLPGASNMVSAEEGESASTKNAFESFHNFREKIKAHAIKAINEQVDQLADWRKSNVEPDHCQCVLKFNKIGKPTDKERSEFKNDHIENLDRYIEISDAYREFLDDKLKSKFAWSKSVISHIQKVEKKLESDGKKWRHAVPDLWDSKHVEDAKEAVKLLENENADSRRHEQELREQLKADLDAARKEKDEAVAALTKANEENQCLKNQLNANGKGCA
mmetsp:Transcript_88350/g.202043  ORF Transcript_88350/g.202043 Transcript_88350/m.202043 type:complete len:1235 (+) Transcript_88350:35-3739(+)